MHRVARGDSAGNPKTTCQSIIGLMRRRRSSQTSVTAPFAIMRKVFSCAKKSSASRSPIVKGRKSQCGTSENSTLRKIWDEFRRLKIGSHISSLNAGCMGSDRRFESTSKKSLSLDRVAHFEAGFNRLNRAILAAWVTHEHLATASVESFGIVDRFAEARF